jgi:hypothetical protein
MRNGFLRFLAAALCMLATQASAAILIYDRQSIRPLGVSCQRLSWNRLCRSRH